MFFPLYYITNIMFLLSYFCPFSNFTQYGDQIRKISRKRRQSFRRSAHPFLNLQ
ncbi:hypothetical protein CLOSYM_03702 [[Clostridium] symbiosum ATCC 14940]|uniref:Uncharacterized protein n=1 Tax=[Clostridium] symbiosum ATCC 14940 TaxID=411472 RepID=A0ABC9TTW9_CLOSY|nr:hypothetical protein CLOSYM_03702 [[Clostridium] symbiosum ATCC 14940]